MKTKTTKQEVTWFDALTSEAKPKIKNRGKYVLHKPPGWKKSPCEYSLYAKISSQRNFAIGNLHRACGFWRTLKYLPMRVELFKPSLELETQFKKLEYLQAEFVRVYTNELNNYVAQVKEAKRLANGHGLELTPKNLYHYLHLKENEEPIKD